MMRNFISRTGLAVAMAAALLLSGCGSGADLSYPTLFGAKKQSGLTLTQKERDAMIQDLSALRTPQPKGAFTLK